MAGGKKLDEFVDRHFSRVEKKSNRTNRWSMKCRYCTRDTVIKHRELRCTVHLSKYEQCPNAPDHVRKEALQRLAVTKRGVLSSTPIDEHGSPSDPYVVDDASDDDGVVFP